MRGGIGSQKMEDEGFCFERPAGVYLNCGRATVFRESGSLLKRCGRGEVRDEEDQKVYLKTRDPSVSVSTL